MNENDDGTHLLQTSTTTINVLEGLKELNGATLTEVTNHLNVSKGTAYNHLSTLEANDIVVHEDDRYRLSPRFILIGEHVRHESPLYQFGKEKVDEIVRETGEYAQLMTEQHGLAIVVYLQRGEKAIGSDYPTQMQKRPLYLHHTAAGKAILSRLPRERIDEIIRKHGLKERTDNTITSRERLLDELETVREQGYAYNREEEVEGLRAVGAPIVGPDDSVLGALSLSGPRSRLQGDRFRQELPETVVDAADVIEVNINMSRDVDEL